MSITATIQTVDSAGNAAPNVSITYAMTIAPTGNGLAFNATPATLTSDSNGLISFSVAVGATYSFWSGLNAPLTFLIPTNATSPYQLANWTYNIVS